MYHNNGMHLHWLHSHDVKFHCEQNSVQQLLSLSESFEMDVSSSSSYRLPPSPFERAKRFEANAHASDIIIEFMRSKAGWRKELCKVVSFNELTKEGPLIENFSRDKQE